MTIELSGIEILIAGLLSLVPPAVCVFMACWVRRFTYKAVQVDLSLPIRQQDKACEGAFAAYVTPLEDNDDPYIALNIAATLGTVVMGDVSAKDLPYMIAENIAHEVFHALEDWAGVEFDEDRVEALIEKYRAAGRRLELKR